MDSKKRRSCLALLFAAPEHGDRSKAKGGYKTLTPEMINGLFALGGAALGAVLAAVFSWVHHSQTQERSELTISTSKPSELVAVHDRLNGMIKITVGRQEVDSVSMLTYAVANSGNTPLEELDIPVIFSNGCCVIGGTTPGSSFTHESSELITHLEDDGTARITVNFLNPGENISGELIISGSPNDVSVRFRRPGVRVIHRKDFNPVTPSVVMSSVFEGVRSSVFLHMYANIVVPGYREYIRRQKENEDLLTNKSYGRS